MFRTNCSMRLKIIWNSHSEMNMRSSLLECSESTSQMPDRKTGLKTKDRCIMKGFNYTERLIIKLVALVFLAAAAFSAELLSGFGLAAVMVVLFLGMSAVSGQHIVLDRRSITILRKLISICMKGGSLKRSRKAAEKPITLYRRNAS